MSEKYFDYSCVAAENGENNIPLNITNPYVDENDARTRAFAFFSYVEYGKKGLKTRVQIVIPQELIDYKDNDNDNNNKYIGIRIYRLVNGISFPENLTNLENDGFVRGKKIYFDSEDVKSSHSIFLDVEESDKERALSCVGVLKLLVEGVDTYDNQRGIEAATYKFVVNHVKRETISYEAKHSEGKDKIAFTVKYPRIKTEIELKVIYKEDGTLPIFVKDFEEGDSLNTEENKLILKPTNRRKNSLRFSVTTNSDAQKHFRLAFADPEMNKYFVLRDETMYDKKDNAGTQRALPARTCPYCRGALNLDKFTERFDENKRPIIYTCDGGRLNFTGVYDSKFYKGLNVVCKEKNLLLSKSYENLIIPTTYFEMPELKITVVGMTDSGKTLYLSALFNMGADGKCNGNPPVLSKIVKTFGTKSASARLVESWNVVEEKKEIGNVHQIGVLEGRLKRYGDFYGINGVESVPKRTGKDDAAMLFRNPVVFKLESLCSVCFYDVPGEAYNGAIEQKKDEACIPEILAVKVADCFVFTMDADKKKAVKALYEIHELVKAFSEIRSSMGNDSSLDNIPIAIVLTKYDKRLRENCTYYDDCFDDNDNLTIEDIPSMLNSGKYEGSSLQRHIDLSSYEIEQYIRSINGTYEYEEMNEKGEIEVHTVTVNGDIILDEIKEKCPNVKFFNCSALGSEYCVSDKTSEKKFLMKPKSMRMELPIIWLMYQKGIIRR